MNDKDEKELYDVEQEHSQSTDEAPAFVPGTKYEAALFRVYKNDSLSEGLRVLSVAIALLTVYAFAYTIFTSLAAREVSYVIRLVISTAPAFLVVSIARKAVNAPRPYELFSFYETAPKKKSGESFPSRHVFSVFAIGSALLFENLPLGVCLIISGVILAATRVLLGIHFVKDTVAGALIGLISGTLGMLISGLFF